MQAEKNPACILVSEYGQLKEFPQIYGRGSQMKNIPLPFLLFQKKKRQIGA